MASIIKQSDSALVEVSAKFTDGMFHFFQVSIQFEGHIKSEFNQGFGHILSIIGWIPKSANLVFAITYDQSGTFPCFCWGGEGGLCLRGE